MSMKGKKIVLGITGSIAAYKAAILIRGLIKKGAEVQVVITPAGKEFITPITLSALTSKPVISEFFAQRDGTWNSHVDLGLWADAMIIAPATASTIGKMANGIADNMLITTYLSMKAPVFVAPAMDLDMFAHPSTRKNLDTLRSYGNHIIEPAEGELASHLVGKSIFKVSKAEKIEDILEVYVDWYYDKFLYHHKEQFLDFFEFLTTNKECNSLKITEEIEDYFTLPFIQIKEDEEYYSTMSFEELSKQVINGIGKNTLSNLERINSNSYSYKLDYLLFVGNWSRLGRLETTRLERFWGKLTEEEKQIFLLTMAEVYANCTEDAKWNYLRYIDDRNNITGLKLSQVVDVIYKKLSRDMLFYGIMARAANEKFNGFVRR